MSLNEILTQKTILIFDLDGTIVDLKVDWDKLKDILNERFSNIYEDSCGFESISACLSYIVSNIQN
jgi:phosphoglycolate phosphatase-like HAD superfamily hydrolase